MFNRVGLDKVNLLNLQNIKVSYLVPWFQRKDLFRVWCVCILLIFTSKAFGQEAPASRSKIARALFDQHCSTSGERIFRTVDDVDGIFLMKLRLTRNLDKQYELDDPYGSDLEHDAYIASFLKPTYDVKVMSTIVVPKPLRKHYPTGFQFVEAVDRADGRRYRYTASIEEPGQSNPHYLKGVFRSVVAKDISSRPTPRYGVTFDDISTPRDRQYWIAGSSLKIVDLVKNEVIAERIGYMFDPAQGSKAGYRSPWIEAASFACPSFGLPYAANYQAGQTIRFTEKVLHPKRREK